VLDGGHQRAQGGDAGGGEGVFQGAAECVEEHLCGVGWGGGKLGLGSDWVHMHDVMGFIAGVQLRKSGGQLLMRFEACCNLPPQRKGAAKSSTFLQ